MSRQDRLYDMIQILRDGRLHRAQDIADRLGVSVRTVYRDMETLVASGVPIEGSRGLGYRTTAAITLPPLNLSATELEALHLGIATVGAASEDEELQAAARSLSAKIDAALPEDRSTPPTGWGLATYPFADASRGFEYMPSLRKSIRARQKVRISIRGDDGQSTTRAIRPLRLDYWGRIWTIAAWCELRADFRTFRLDRIDDLTVLPQLFVEEEGKSLADFAQRSQVAANT